MKILFAVLFLFSSISRISAQNDAALQSVPTFQSASDFPKERIQKIEKLALEHWPLTSAERTIISGAFKTGRPIKDFSERGDLIWEIRVIWLSGVPSGIIWINEKNKKILSIGPSHY